MKNLCEIKDKVKPNFWQKIVKIDPKENAIIEINNLFATKSIKDIKPREIEEISNKYNVNLRKRFLGKLKELYGQHLFQSISDHILTDQEVILQNYLKKLLMLNETEAEEILGEIGSEIYRNKFVEAISNGKLEKSEEEYLDNLQNSLRLSPNDIEKIKNENRQIYIQEMDEAETERMIDLLAREAYIEWDGELSMYDPMILEAARLVVQAHQGSASLIQRTLGIGYNRSSRIIEKLEELGIVGRFDGNSPRTVNFKNLDDLENYLKLNPNLISKTDLFYDKHKEKIEQRKAEYHRIQEIENDHLEKEAIKQKMIERERKKRLHKEALNELIESGEIFNTFTGKNGRREPIPQDIMDKVWNRDGGKCVKCGSQDNLEFDHIIPISKGGATSYRNIQLLCKKCNLDKSNKIG